MTPSPPPAWYPDPADPSRLRYWDGMRWTAHVHDPSGSATAMPPVGDFLARAFGCAWRSLPAVLPLLLLVLAATAALAVASLASTELDEWVVDAIETATETPAGAEVELPPVPSLGAAVLPLVALGAVVVVGPWVLVVAWIPPMRDALEGGEARLRGIGEIVRALGRLLLVGLVVAAVALAVLVALVLPVVLVGPLLLLLVVPGLLALFVVAWWLAVRLALVLPLVVLEGETFAAFRRSFAATRGHGWAILGRMLVFALITGMVTGGLNQAVSVAGSASPELVVVSVFLGVAVQLVATPVGTAPFVVLHQVLGTPREVVAR